MKNTSDQTIEQARAIVEAILNEADQDPEQFLQDFSDQGSYLANVDLIKDELARFNDKVIKLTAQVMPLLLERGIVEPGQDHTIAKIIAYNLADRWYNPKLYHPSWAPRARATAKLVNSHLSWR